MKRRDERMEPTEAGDWFLRQLRLKKMAREPWRLVARRPEGELRCRRVCAPLDVPPGWQAAAWLWTTRFEAWFVGGWQHEAGGWLPVGGAEVGLKWHLVGRVLWRVRPDRVTTALRASARRMELWSGRGASREDGAVGAMLMARGLKAGLLRTGERAVDGLLVRWVADEPLHVRGGTLLGMLEAGLADAAGLQVRRPDFRLAGLAAMEREWARRWRAPRGLVEIEEA